MKFESNSIESDNLLPRALEYARLGYNVIPVRYTGKRKEPLCEHGAKDGTTDEYQIREWWTKHPKANIGLVATNMLVVDLDVGEGKDGIQDFEEIKKVVPGIPEGCPTALTGGGGRHLIFKKPNRPVKARPGIVFNGKRCNIDLRSGYSYIVVSPSIHQSGNRYKWEIPLCSPDDLPEMPDSFFAQCSETKPQQVLPVPSTKASLEAIAQCRHYVSNIPGIDEESHKGTCHNKLLSVVCTIFHDFGLNEDEGWGILVDFNARCTPPWSEKELRHKVEHALGMVTDNQGRPRGWRFTEAIRDNDPIAVSVDECIAKGWARHRAAEGGNSSKIKGVWLSDMDIADYEWIWENRIPKNELTLIAGAGGSGKTTFVAYLCAAVSNGGVLDENGVCTGTWPDGAPCEEGAVLYLWSEDDPSRTLGPRIIAAGGKKENVCFLRYMVNNAGQEVQITVDDRGDLGEFIEYLYANYNKKVSLIIFDPITAFLGGVDSNKNDQVRCALNRIPEFLEQHSCSAIGIIHNKKGLSLADTAADSVCGAGAFTATARAVYAVYKDKEYRDPKAAFADITAGIDVKEVSRVLPAKGNIWNNPTGIVFEIAQKEGVTDSRGHILNNPIPYAKILRCDLDQEADDFRTEEAKRRLRGGGDGKRSNGFKCADWLEQQLLDREGNGLETTQKELKNLAMNMGGFKEQTVNNNLSTLKKQGRIFTYLKNGENYVTTNSEEAIDVPNPIEDEQTELYREHIKARDQSSEIPECSRPA